MASGPAAGAATTTSYAASIAITVRNNVAWAPSDSVPSYTPNNGASRVSTNQPSLPGVGTD